jgi:hypothetical protein
MFPRAHIRDEVQFWHNGSSNRRLLLLDAANDELCAASAVANIAVTNVVPRHRSQISPLPAAASVVVVWGMLVASGVVSSSSNLTSDDSLYEN